MEKDGILPLLAHGLVNRDNELVLPWLFSNEPYGIERDELTRSDTHEVHERTAQFHCPSEGNIVVGTGVSSSPFVAQVAVRTFTVFVWTILRTCGVGGANTQGRLETGNCSDASHVLKKGQRVSFELERRQLLRR